MTGTKNDRDMTGVLYGGVWENLSWKEHLYNYSFSPNNKSEFIGYTAGESLRTFFKARDALGVISSEMDQNNRI